MPMGAAGGYMAQPLHFQSAHQGQALRHSVSAADLSRPGGLQGGPVAGYPAMFGLGAPMAPLAELPHIGSPRAPPQARCAPPHGHVPTGLNSSVLCASC